ncbi:hypothetical protein JW872_01260 [Candidatus Babeliales bacterium]|nr:hypothetical protein [Candidatus Babeliales bacterium]
MKVIILGPTIQQTYHAAWIEFDTPVGNFVVKKDHVPEVLTLKEKSRFIIWLNSGKQEIIDITSGVIKITRENAMVLLDQ